MPFRRTISRRSKTERTALYTIFVGVMVRFMLNVGCQWSLSYFVASVSLTTAFATSGFALTIMIDADLRDGQVGLGYLKGVVIQLLNAF